MPTASPADPDVRAAAAQRRTFAIISHPDAGKTTLTEKFLLFAGAVQEAGAVKSRKQARTTTSDWMELEKQRGISISSTALHFTYGGWYFNLLDTPGHADFSEDTYRTLCAADAAVMVLDAARGLEPQTLKLFRVCRDRGLPIVTFVNKCDRPGLPPLALLDEIASEIGLRPVPLSWPVADGADFAGIVDRATSELVRFERTSHGATIGGEQRVPLADADPGTCPPDRWQAAVEELALLELEEIDLDHDAFLAGRETPVFFGSALANFGVRMLLEQFARLAPSPAAQPIVGGAVSGGGPAVRPIDAPFSGLVFKVQANMDPRHRDRVAFIRVNSGRFDRGMTATLARTGRPFQLKYAHQLFAQDRNTVDSAMPGDIVGVVNAAGLQVGDTLYAGPPAVFPPIPTFAPERFALVRNRDTGRYKQFRAGLRQLDEEGVVHVLHRPEYGQQEPVLAGVGQLQFEVAEHRMANEFGCAITLSSAPWSLARRISADDAPALQGQRRVQLAETRHGELLVLFESEHVLRWVREDHPDLRLEELGHLSAQRDLVPG
ncbi:MAG: peptide chain release factor 3 [Actinobacteria bacterium]|nr:peptide chain release factor 3 [Actinomycetota bacterium]